MHYSPLPSPILREKPWYPCWRVKLPFPSHYLAQDTTTPPKVLSFAFDFVRVQTPLSIFTSGAQKLAGAHSSPTHLLALLPSKTLSFDLCTLERKENKRLKPWESSISTKSDLLFFVLMVLPLNEPFALPPDTKWPSLTDVQYEAHSS